MSAIPSFVAALCLLGGSALGDAVSGGKPFGGRPHTDPDGSAVLLIAQPIGGPPVDGEPIGEGDEPIGGPPVEGEPVGETDEPIGGASAEGRAVDQEEFGSESLE